MTLKTLVTGIAAAAAVSGAAVGVTSIASPAIAGAECATSAQLTDVIDGLAAPGVGFNSPGKSNLVDGVIGVIEGKTADRLLNNAYASGSLPASFTVSEPVCDQRGAATAMISTPSGAGQTVTFVPGGPLGWKLSKDSATAVLATFGG